MGKRTGNIFQCRHFCAELKNGHPAELYNQVIISEQRTQACFTSPIMTIENVKQMPKEKKTFLQLFSFFLFCHLDVLQVRVNNSLTRLEGEHCRCRALTAKPITYQPLTMFAPITTASLASFSLNTLVFILRKTWNKQQEESHQEIKVCLIRIDVNDEA